MESAHNTLADTGDYMSVSKHLTGDVQSRLSYGLCSKVLPIWSTPLGADVITVIEILHSLYNYSVCV